MQIWTGGNFLGKNKAKWRDGECNEREMTVTAYATFIHDVYGHWKYAGTAQAELMRNLEAIGSRSTTKARTGETVRAFVMTGEVGSLRTCNYTLDV